MQAMRGSSRRTNARTRRWCGAWRLQRLHVLRLRLRLLRLLDVVLSLEQALVAMAWLMMLTLLILQSSPKPAVILWRSAQLRRCTLRATTMQTSWGIGRGGCALASLATRGS